MTESLETICSYRNEKASAASITAEDLYVSTESMGPNRGGVSKTASVPSEGKVSCFRKGDTLVSNIRPYFKKIWKADIDGYCSNDVLVFQPSQRCSADYLYWLLCDDAFFDYVMATSKGTKMPRGDKSAIMSYAIPSNSEMAQRNIASILAPIQAKIEMNAKLNGYLEEWGQSLLKNYQESCATTIPLHNVMDFGNGYAFKSGAYTQSGLYKILTIKNVQDGSVDCSTSNRIDELPPKMKSFCKLQPGNVVLSLTGNVGRVGIVSEENCLLNQRVAVLQPYNYALLPGLYFHFRQKAFQNEMIGIAKGTAQANLSPVETLKLEMPYNESFLDISQKLKPAFDLILANTIESKRLTVFRDTLLPKLMSSEIDVSKVDLTQLLNSHLA